MTIQGMINWVIENMLLVAILAAIFFFGDVIYGWIVRVSKNMGRGKFWGFVIALLMVLVLSLLPVMLQGFMHRLLTFWGIIALIVVIIFASYMKYTRKF